jgi:hypothetical protein
MQIGIKHEVDIIRTEIFPAYSDVLNTIKEMGISYKVLSFYHMDHGSKNIYILLDISDNDDHNLIKVVFGNRII